VAVFYVSISDCYLQLMSRYFQLPVFVCMAFAHGCAHDAGTQLNVGGGLSLRPKYWEGHPIRCSLHTDTLA